MNCSALQRIAPQGSAKQRNTAQRNAKQIGLAIGSSGLPDVFSHQPHRKERQGSALHRTAPQSKSGWLLETVAFPMCFHIKRGETQRTAPQCSAAKSSAKQSRAEHPGLGIRKSAFARSF